MKFLHLFLLFGSLLSTSAVLAHGEGSNLEPMAFGADQTAVTDGRVVTPAGSLIYDP